MSEPSPRQVYNLPTPHLIFIQTDVEGSCENLFSFLRQFYRRRPMPLAEKIMILRLGHRIPRDLRVTTHVCLTARAFGADGLILADVVDRTIEETVKDVSKRFGGTFLMQMGEPWRQVIKKWKADEGDVVHLTAYGIPLPQIIEEIRASPNAKLVIVGASKVPGEVFQLATWNVAVTNQPISEVSALAVFLDRYFEGKQFSTEFKNAEVKIVPSARRKQVVNINEQGR